ncbi:hypothetical protein [Flavobacterium branchiicola]|uniref:Uncharacterized protein n=1 Tax=Flavobacterium branchiicola TaxID=1114875 RepID=A0ABV9PCW0_9FLAO|nr:hypothetical protein [Flavobacterium branchiicola]MBS7253659.1 hypothetical protein [Flavobacterium branchiicola]
MNEVIFFLALVISLLLVYRVLKSKSKMIVKLVYLLVIFILLFFVGLFSFIISWKKGGPNREEVIPLKNSPKTIYFFNETKQSINIIVNFKYSDEEKKSIKYNPYYNKIDTIKNLRSGENKYREISTLYNDSITKFPKNFNVKITDSIGEIIKEYNKEEFFNSIEKSKYVKNIDKECKENEWDIRIK